MTATQIQSRLAEIDSEQAAFDSRDFDAELSQVIVNGGNVDALEEQHLQAERLARRLRVERQALQAALPEAKQEETASQVAELLEEYDQLREKHHEKADEIAAALTALVPMVEELSALGWGMRQAATSADAKVNDLERKEGLLVNLPALSNPQHTELAAMGDFLSKLHARLSQANTGTYYQGIATKLTYQPADAA
ncbi:hypothetical protein ACM25P_02655 [Vreelandella alkaliphila]|uniref:hypothetical protein n=1 Tax=Vreelandella alkaliphila TaxID=272774 RepID=UPI0039F4DEF9